jgi:TolB-like protein
LVSERERLREVALESLARLLSHQTRSDEPEAALATGLRLLALDPLQEAVHRALIRIYARSGRRNAALRQYQSCVDTLRRELSVEPEAETQQLYQEVLRGRSTPSTATRAAIADLDAVPAGSRPSDAPALPRARPERPSIAVLPFTNMSGDAEQEYFADGMVDEIITALSRFKELFVIARNSSFVYKGRAVDIQQVAGELGVRYVLEGSVRRAGQRVRITGQLIDAATRAHLWADRFDGGLEDVFGLQDRVTERVIGALQPALRQAEIERARRKPPASLDAYDHVLSACPR